MQLSNSLSLTSPIMRQARGWEALRRSAPAVPTSFTNTIYVSGASPSALPAGNDTTGDGSAAAPYATLTKALSVIPSAGAYKVLCDGTFAENTSSGGRWILNAVFAAPVLFDSYSGAAADFIITNVSGTNGVVSIRAVAANKIYIRRATIRSATDGNNLFQSNPDTLGHRASDIRFYDCVLEHRTQSSAAITAVDLRSNNGITGLYFVRCEFKRVVGGSTTYDPVLIGTTFQTATIANQPHSDVGLWDCFTTGSWRSFLVVVTGVAKFTVVGCTISTTTGYGIGVGSDSSGGTDAKCTDVYIANNTVTCTGTNPHGILVGSNVISLGLRRKQTE